MLLQEERDLTACRPRRETGQPSRRSPAWREVKPMALRRLCDPKAIAYDAQRASISKLQAALFQPSNGVAVISSTENKQLTAWGDSRNKADRGKFADLTQSEVLSMVIGVRGFIDKHLP